MNRSILVAVILVLSIVTPGVIFAGIKPDKPFESMPVTQMSVTTAGNAEKIRISLLLPDNTIERLPLESYITQVVLREMPAQFELEALKAQAVVARTYTLRRLEGNPKHIGAAVCTNPSCCQGYCTPEEYLLSGGSEQSLNKVADAVRMTEGLVLTYSGSLIEATYFSCSGGMTEDAAAVWGEDIPYLQAIESPGEEGATHYTDTVKLTAKEFAEKLGIPDCGSADLQMHEVVLTAGGGIESAKIGDSVFTGTELREKLKLNSTSFYISAVGDSVVITTKGFGHRVGMSQYGAEAMAVQGSDFEYILQHYYQGTQLVLYSDLH